MPTEILYEAEDKATHYPGDRLRLTGAEVLALTEFCRRDAFEQAARAVEDCIDGLSDPTPSEFAAAIRALK